MSEIDRGRDYNSMKPETNESRAIARLKRIGCDIDPDSTPCIRISLPQATSNTPGVRMASMPHDMLGKLLGEVDG